MHDQGCYFSCSRAPVGHSTGSEWRSDQAACSGPQGSLSAVTVLPHSPPSRIAAHHPVESSQSKEPGNFLISASRTRLIVQLARTASLTFQMKITGIASWCQFPTRDIYRLDDKVSARFVAFPDSAPQIETLWRVIINGGAARCPCTNKEKKNSGARSWLSASLTHSS